MQYFKNASAQGGQDKTVFYWNSNELLAALQVSNVFANQTIIQA